VSGAQEADRARDARGEQGDVRDGGLGDDVRAALGSRGDHHDVGRREECRRAGPGERPEPAPARVPRRLGPRAGRPRRRQRGARVDDADARRRGEGPHGARGEEGVLDRPEVREHARDERVLRPAPGPRPASRRRRRLEDRARLRARRGRERAEGRGLEHDEAVGGGDRRARGRRAREVPVDVRPRERHDDAAVGVRPAKRRDGRRPLACVERHEDVGDGALRVPRDDAVAEPPQEPGPAPRRHEVPRDRALRALRHRARRRDRDPHRASAQVRKPANGSRRPGR
jgi:hypothetical protein